ncbi:MAG: nucleotidyltransferase domain-containing protein [Saccharolobus sp.]|uniref:nucleotidyltransferase domain-containing protein n=1 Tax=Saccharolobus TaxID=2100760 RepID=UPI001F100D33|nr:nucleotidyltransferase domain-containing protein [Saccharolobus shibatae]MCH4815855.1 nucleotidyltransferase domain-containing protein [Saccharolobus shibatae]
MSSWVKFRFSHLKRWREYAEKVAKATKDLEPNSEVYIIGGVAEDRITVLSDIDILIIIKRKLNNKERKKLREAILLRAMDSYNLPFDAPVEIHLEDEDEAKRFFELSKKAIKIL